MAAALCAAAAIVAYRAQQYRARSARLGHNDALRRHVRKIKDNYDKIS
jgi:hypothetical protein